MADHTQADANTATDAGQQSAQTQAQATQERVFTQAELDKILNERLARERSKYADYDELKKAREDAEAAQKSEIEKAAERAAKAEARLKEIEAQAKTREQIATAKETAVELGFDPKRLDKVIRLVELTPDADADAIKKALEALSKDMPELLTNKRAPATGATNPAKDANATMGETDAQRRARLFGNRGSLDYLGEGTLKFYPKAGE